MRKLIVIAALAALASQANAREEQKVYKWTDKDGNVYYGDSIPAEYAERPKEVLNDQGVAVEELAGKKTAEQLEAEAREQQLRTEQELQIRADRALLATYLSVEEIEMHRDRRVELFQAQSRVTELYLKNLNRRLEDLRTEASRYQPYNDDADAPMIDESLADDLRKTKDTITRHERNLAKYEADEKQIIERFNNDIERFKRLKGISNKPEERAASVTS
jgi:hypothetical protein